MLIQPKNISDQTLFSMLNENKSEAWHYLHEKYAPAMYSLIFNLTDDEILTEEILVESFLQLRQKQILSNVSCALCPAILRHTYSFATEQLKERGIAISTQYAPPATLIAILCSQQLSINELANNFNITEAEVKKNLRAEFLELRAKNQEVQSVNHQNEFNKQYS